MSTVVFHILSNACQYLIMYNVSIVCQYLTQYRLLVSSQPVHCCLLQSVFGVSVTNNVQALGSVSLYPLSSSTILHFFSVRHTFRSLALCHYVQCCRLKSLPCLPVPYNLPPCSSVSLCPQIKTKVFHCLSVRHTLPSLGSVSLCPLLPSAVCPFIVSISKCTYIASVSLCPLLPYIFCPISVNTSNNTIFVSVSLSTAVFYSLSNVCQYLTRYILLVLCQYVH